MDLLILYFPVMVILVDIPIMLLCIGHLQRIKSTKYFSKDVWLFIIILGSFAGQALYYMYEMKDS